MLLSYSPSSPCTDFAKLLGSKLGGGLSGAHVVSALQYCSQTFKANVLIAIAADVVDLAQSRTSIEGSLTDWERILTSKALDEAMVAQAL